MADRTPIRDPGRVREADPRGRWLVLALLGFFAGPAGAASPSAAAMALSDVSEEARGGIRLRLDYRLSPRPARSTPVRAAPIATPDPVAAPEPDSGPRAVPPTARAPLPIAVPRVDAPAGAPRWLLDAVLLAGIGGLLGAGLVFRARSSRREEDDEPFAQRMERLTASASEPARAPARVRMPRGSARSRAVASGGSPRIRPGDREIMNFTSAQARTG